MKKKILAVLLVLLCGLLVLAGCQEEENPPAETQKPVEYLRIAENETTQFKLVSYLKDSELVGDFASDVSRRIGATLSVVDEAEAGSAAIYIGTAEQLSGKVTVSADVVYTAYEVIISDGNIYIAMADDILAEETLDAVQDLIVRIEDGVYGIDLATAGIKNISNISEVVPMFETEKGRVQDPHDCGNGNYVVRSSSMNAMAADEIAAYEKKLVAAGYTLYAENTANENRFVTYLKGDTMIHCMYFKAMNDFRIVYGPKTYLGAEAPITDYEKVVTPSVSIIAATDSVLSMVVQLADGSFVIIDGGWGTNAVKSVTLNKGTTSEYAFDCVRDAKTDMETLYNFLKDNTPGGGKPQVTWMITHCDPDHITLPSRFIKDYADKFDLNTICYNFPNLYNIGLGESGGSTNDPTTFTAYAESFTKAADKYFPDVQHFVYHTGQKLYLPGCEIEFLMTASEDYWPSSMPWCNHTSGAWKFTIEGKTILFTGDIESGLCNQMAKVFGNYLKSDILQVVHHGSNGATLPFYQKVQPEVCFWGCLEEYIKYDLRHTGKKAGWDFNKYLWDTADAHYAGSKTVTVLLPSLEIK